MNKVMSIWAFVAVLLPLYATIRFADARRAADGTIGAIATVIAAVVYTVPAVYILGWIILPAFGIGAIR